VPIRVDILARVAAINKYETQRRIWKITSGGSGTRDDWRYVLPNAGSFYGLEEMRQRVDGSAVFIVERRIEVWLTWLLLDGASMVVDGKKAEAAHRAASFRKVNRRLAAVRSDFEAWRFRRQFTCELKQFQSFLHGKESSGAGRHARGALPHDEP